ncbi:phosphatase domain-containing protein [Marinoscillum furvescens]|uniref:Phosphatidate phosphatase APP1 n=1 Tax=Marinoscillum furvescens DSM 4134 TaxID=1122208 RepID=A0A3D9L3H8_MARFU|nr:App1 family protein [Marinoscillum furvescens]RED97531.1 phosphatidate phosphatase APP1 [Marinoscillum furvescens DSM 4134]
MSAIEKPILKVYEPFANKQLTYICGHVLRSVAPQREEITKNPFKNALEMYRRYRVKPAKGQQVFLHIDGLQYEAVTSAKGFFKFEISTPTGATTIPANVVVKQAREISCKVSVEVSNPDVLIVSDVDDTVLVSHATNIWKKLYLLLTKNHESRKTFEGICDLFGDLTQNAENSKFFYVSSSEWNLYDFLKDFMSFHELPGGVFLLQDLKSGLRDLFKSGRGSHRHKYDKIKHLINFYPEAKFMLIGDSGQHDPFIYRELAEEFPERIKHIFIRDVRKSRREEIRKMSENINQTNVGMSIIAK